MEITPVDKRPFYIWLSVIILNVTTMVASVFIEVQSQPHSSFEDYFFIFRNPLPVQYWIALGITLILTVVPILIARLHNQKKNYIGYGIPVALLLPVIYFVWDAMTCTGKLCQLGDYIAIIVLVPSAIIFAIFYTVGRYFSVLDIWYARLFVLVEIILIIGAFIYFGFNILR